MREIDLWDLRIHVVKIRELNQRTRRQIVAGNKILGQHHPEPGTTTLGVRNDQAISGQELVPFGRGDRESPRQKCF